MFLDKSSNVARLEPSGIVLSIELEDVTDEEEPLVELEERSSRSGSDGLESEQPSNNKDETNPKKNIFLLNIKTSQINHYKSNIKGTIN